MTPQLAELKKEALGLFGKWQAMIVSRINDLEVYEPLTHALTPTRGANGSGFAERGGFQIRVGRTRGGTSSRVRKGGPVPAVSGKELPVSMLRTSQSTTH